MLFPRHAFFSALLFSSFALTPYLHAQDGNVLTWHNGTERLGTVTGESTLKLSTVNSKTFGKLALLSADGVVDAQPLHVAGLIIAGKKRDVLFFVTEHDSVYADDAITGETLWKKSVLQAGETTSTDQGCNAITPEIGITSTPVIDLSKGPNGAIYVVSMARGASGNYYQRISALDLVTGAQLFGGPTTITASYPGTGDNSSNGSVVFAPGKYADRAALLEWNGQIYTAWASHCDDRPYTGWIISYSASTLKQTSILNLTPNGNDGAIWMSGAGLTGTATKILFLDGNGTFDTTLNADGFPAGKDFGNGFIELGQSPGGQLQVEDYYATDDTVQQSKVDTDLGAGGAIAFPPIYDNSGNVHNLAAGAGKDTNIYLVDRDNMGKYHPNGGYIYQVLTGAIKYGAWSAPAFFDNKLYYGGQADNIKAFSFSDAKLVATPASMSSITFPYPGATPSISSNQGADGILWAVSHASPSILYAYSAEDLATELYDSNQSGTRDQFGATGHFITPTVINGHVYVGTTAGVAVFGLLK